MSDLVTGGNISLPEPKTLRAFVKQHKRVILIISAFPVAAILTLVLLLPGLITRVQYLMLDSELNTAVHDTATGVDHALAHGTTLAQVMRTPEAYVADTAEAQSVHIHAGSCNTSDPNGYTVTAINPHTASHVYASATGHYITNASHDLTTLLRAACVK